MIKLSLASPEIYHRRVAVVTRAESHRSMREKCQLMQLTYKLFLSGNIREASNLTELQLLYWAGHQPRPSAVTSTTPLRLLSPPRLISTCFSRLLPLLWLNTTCCGPFFMNKTVFPSSRCWANRPLPEIVDLSTEPDPGEAARH